MEGEQTAFPSSFLVGNQLVTAPPADIRIDLPWGKLVLSLVVHRATLSHRYLDDHQSAMQGVVSGILSAEELVSAIKASAPLSYCTGSTSLLEIASQAADIGLDGTQDPTKECDGISLGLGYDTGTSLLGPSVPAPIPADPCQ